MKFRVCGGLDAPDWVLAQTSRVGTLAVAPGTLTKLAVCAARNLEAAGATAAGHGSTVDTIGETAALQDALAFSSRTELEAALGVVEFLVTNSVKYEVRGSRLIHELTQLGLSKAGADELEAVVGDHWDKLCRGAKQSILRLGRPHPETPAKVIVPDEAHRVDAAETTIDYNDKTSDQDQKLSATTNGLVSISMVNEVPITFSSDPAKLALLVEELSRAVNIATQAQASLS